MRRQGEGAAKHVLRIILTGCFASVGLLAVHTFAQTARRSTCSSEHDARPFDAAPSRLKNRTD
jgi:hypothetical protein